MREKKFSIVGSLCRVWDRVSVGRHFKGLVTTPEPRGHCSSVLGESVKRQIYDVHPSGIHSKKENISDALFVLTHSLSLSVRK